MWPNGTVQRRHLWRPAGGHVGGIGVTGVGVIGVTGVGGIRVTGVGNFQPSVEITGVGSESDKLQVSDLDPDRDNKCWIRIRIGVTGVGTMTAGLSPWCCGRETIQQHKDQGLSSTRTRV